MIKTTISSRHLAECNKVREQIISNERWILPLLTQYKRKPPSSLFLSSQVIQKSTSVANIYNEEFIILKQRECKSTIYAISKVKDNSIYL